MDSYQVYSEQIKELVEILDIKPIQAESLLSKTGGNIERATSLHFKGFGSPVSSSSSLSKKNNNINNNNNKRKKSNVAKSTSKLASSPTTTTKKSKTFGNKNNNSNDNNNNNNYPQKLIDLSEDITNQSSINAELFERPSEHLKNDFQPLSNLNESISLQILDFDAEYSHEAPSQTPPQSPLKFSLLNLAVSEDQFEPISNPNTSNYSFLVEAFDLISATSKRLEKQKILVNFFRQLIFSATECIIPSVFLASNQLVDCYESWTLGVGGATVNSCLCDTTNAKTSTISALYRELGDLGDVAFRLKSTQSLIMQPKKLTINSVYESLIKIGNESGNGSENRKKNIMKNLIRSCQKTEIKWLIRTLISNIRTGATRETILAAVAVASLYHNKDNDESIIIDKNSIKEAQQRIKIVYSICPSITKIINSIIKGGLNNMEEECKPTIKIPMMPMLAKPLKSVEEACRRLGDCSISNNKNDDDIDNLNIVNEECYKQSFTAEYKYDGQRCQIHVLRTKHEQDGNEKEIIEMKLFSRNLEDMTERFPDVIQNLNDAISVNGRFQKFNNIILDAEIVPIQINNIYNIVDKILPFQELSKRPKKNVDIDNISIKVALYIFDVLYLNDKSLINETLMKRREIMDQCICTSINALVQFTHRIDVLIDENNNSFESGLVKIQELLEKSVIVGCEGLVVKMLPSTYIPSRGSERSNSWGKLKKDYLEGLADSFDLIPIGAYWGNGRKAGWFSPFLLGVIDITTGKIQSLCRVMSGMNDAFYIENTEFWKKHSLPRDEAPNEWWEGLETRERPSVLFDPNIRDKIVWEIKGADLQLSPVHGAGMGINGNESTGRYGIGLRFPRFIKIREDKTKDTATNSLQIIEAFNSQSVRITNNDNDNDNDNNEEKEEEENKNEDWEI